MRRKEETFMESLAYSELCLFRDFLNAKLACGESPVTPEQALDEFRILHLSKEELEDSVAAIRESIAEIDAGAPGKLASEYMAEVRARYGWDD